MCRCRRFFENQRVDEIGFYSVKLQKVLIALIVFHLISLLFGVFSNWLSILVELVLFWICFYGAYKRNHKPLRAYVCINVALMILGVIVFICAIIFVSAVHNDSEPVDVIDITVPDNDTNSDMVDLLPPINNGTDITGMINIIPAVVTRPNVPTEFFIVYVLIVFLSALVLVLKLVSIIMAMRLARMICEYNRIHLSHPEVCHKEPTQPQQSSYIPLNQMPQEQGQPPMYPQMPMYFPVVVNQPNGQPQYMYPNPYFVPQAMYTPMAPNQPENNKN